MSEHHADTPPGEVATRTKRRLCPHSRWILARRGKHEVCSECGDRFPCKGCEHLDCIEARHAAGSKEPWPDWVEEVNGALRLSLGPGEATTCDCGLPAADCLGCVG